MAPTTSLTDAEREALAMVVEAYERLQAAVPEAAVEILCGCGWGNLAATLERLHELEERGCPLCGNAFDMELGWLGHG